MVFDTFFCCLDLETGGIVLSFLGIICHFLSFFIVPLYFYIISSLKAIPQPRNYGHYSDVPKNVDPNNYRTTRAIADSRLHDDVAASLGIGDEMLIFGMVIGYGMIFLRIWGSINLFNGIKRRNHDQVLIYVLVDGISRILSLFTSWLFFPFYIVDIFLIYLSVCTISLYKKIQKESKQEKIKEHTTVDTRLSPEMIQNDLKIEQENKLYPQLSSNQENSMVLEAN